MNDPSRPRQIWTRRLLAFFTLRKLRDAKSNALSQRPKGISTRAIVSVKNALGEIPIGISGVRTGIHAFLNAIKEINVTPTTDERLLRDLESDVCLLAEVLEPLGYTESHLFSPELLHQLRRLGSQSMRRKLQVNSRAMKQPISPGENKPRFFFSSRPKNTGGEVNSLAEGLHLALDEFRVTALPMYSVSTMEAAVRPLGIVSNSSCTLLSFSDWVLSHREVMDYRFGRIQNVCCCYREYSSSWRLVRGSTSPSKPEFRVYEMLHVGLLNERGIENWLEIELTTTSTRGIVTFSATNEALVRGAVLPEGLVLGGPALSMTDLAMWIEYVIQVHSRRTPFLTKDVYDMFEPHGRFAMDPRREGLYGGSGLKRSGFTTSILTDGEIRHEK